MVSKASKYGIRAVLFIANQSQKGRRVGIPEISEKTNNPKHFTAKIMQQLSKAGLVNSMKGPTGGFEMTADQRRNTVVKDIIQVIDGDGLYSECALGLESCSDDNPCPLHEQFTTVRSQIDHIHSKKSVEELAQDLNANTSLV